jgi:hypothetical protein
MTEIIDSRRDAILVILNRSEESLPRFPVAYLLAKVRGDPSAAASG